MTHDLDKRSKRHPTARTSRDGVSGFAALLEFKHRRALGEAVSSSEMIRTLGLEGDAQVAVDLLFAEYLEERACGHDIWERLIGDFPQFADELKRQIAFHDALESCASEPDSDEMETDGTAEPMRGSSDDASAPVDSPSPSQSRFPNLPGLQMIQPLGRGGMGIVYLARHRDLNRNVAVKMLLSGAFASDKQMSRFQIEAQTAASLRHPNIVQVDSFGTSNDQPYLVMEYVDGGTLEQYLAEHRLTAREAAELIKVLAETLAETHQRGIIHRDMKPSNILLARANQGDLPQAAPNHDARSQFMKNYVPKISDFGLAKFLVDTSTSSPTLTLFGELAGTPSYMAPEQANGSAVGAWTDIYALGAILYQLLETRPPFPESNPLDTLKRVINDTPRPLSPKIPRDLRIICQKCLQKEPSRRYASMQHLALDLENYLEDRPISARPDPIWERCWRWCRKNKLVTFLATVIFCLLTASLVIVANSRAHLSHLLAETREAQIKERRSHGQALENLWEATLAEARTRQTTKRPGQRFESFAKIREAQRLFERVEATEQRQAKLRDAALSALLLPDYEFKRTWGPTKWFNTEYSADQRIDRIATITPSNNIVVTSGFGAKLTHEFPAANYSGVCLAPDGSQLLVWGDSCELISLEDTERGLIISDKSRGKWIFHPQGHSVIGYTDSGLTIVDLRDRMHTVIPEAIHSVLPLEVSPCGNLLALANQREIQIVDLTRRGVKIKLPAPDESLMGHSLAWHPHYLYLASGIYSGGQISLWDIETGKRLRQYSISGSYCNLSFDPTGQFLIACCRWAGENLVFDVEREQLVLRLPNECGELLRPAPDGMHSRIVAALADEPRRYGEFQTSPILETLLSRFGPRTGRYAPAIDRMSPWLLVTTDRGIEVFDRQRRRAITAIPIGKPTHDSLHQDKLGRIWCNTRNGWLRWQNCDGRKCRLEFISSENYWFPITVNADGTLGLITDGSRLRVMNFQDPAQNFDLGEQVDVRMAEFSSDGRMLAIASWNSGDGVRVWDMATKATVANLDVGFHGELAFSPDNRWLFTSPRGGAIWSTTDWTLRHRIASPDTAGAGFAFAFSPDSRWFVHSQGPGQLRLISLPNFETLCTLHDPHGDPYRRLCIDEQQGAIIGTTAGRVYSVRRWNLRELQRQAAEVGLPLAQEIVPLRGTAAAAPNQPTQQTDSESALPIECDHKVDELISQNLWREFNQLAARGDWRRAFEIYQDALVALPESPKLHNDFAWCLVTAPPEFRQVEMAIHHARRALEIEDHQHAWNTLGTALYRAERFEEAIRAIQKSIDRADDLSRVYDHLILCGCYAAIGELAKAEDHYAQAVAGIEQNQASFLAEALEELAAIRQDVEKPLQRLRLLHQKQPASPPTTTVDDKHP